MWNQDGHSPEPGADDRMLPNVRDDNDVRQFFHNLDGKTFDKANDLECSMLDVDGGEDNVVEKVHDKNWNICQDFGYSWYHLREPFEDAEWSTLQNIGDNGYNRHVRCMPVILVL